MTLRHQNLGDVNVDDPANHARFLAILRGTLNDETPQATLYTPSGIDVNEAGVLPYLAPRPRPAKINNKSPLDNEDVYPSSADLSKCSLLQKLLIERRKEMGLYTTTSYIDKVVAEFRRDHQDAPSAQIMTPTETELAEALTAVGTPETDETASNSSSAATYASSAPVSLIDESQGTSGPEGVEIGDDSSSLQAEVDTTSVVDPDDNSSLQAEPDTGSVVDPDDSSSLQAEPDTGSVVDPDDDTASASDSTILSSLAEGLSQLSQLRLIKLPVQPSIHTTTLSSTNFGQTETDEMSQENRENLTHFDSWGTLAARDEKPKSEVRTVILRGLPATTDFTLVQSLIHGGTIETMRMLPAKTETGTTTAYVTFTTAEAFKQYYEKYPNGFEVRQKGKKFNVLVDKQDHVDVVSSVMQGYLECGATRVLKVSGAEDDWGIMALHKLATGKPSTRQVEAITDTFRNSVRTIYFRFTNIGDAVKFKGTLGRDYDWEACSIEFGEDPCEKATAIRDDQV